MGPDFGDAPDFLNHAFRAHEGLRELHSGFWALAERAGATADASEADPGAGNLIVDFRRALLTRCVKGRSASGDYAPPLERVAIGAKRNSQNPLQLVLAAAVLHAGEAEREQRFLAPVVSVKAVTPGTLDAALLFGDPVSDRLRSVSSGITLEYFVNPVMVARGYSREGETDRFSKGNYYLLTEDAFNEAWRRLDEKAGLFEVEQALQGGGPVDCVNASTLLFELALNVTRQELSALYPSGYSIGGMLTLKATLNFRSVHLSYSLQVTPFDVVQETPPNPGGGLIHVAGSRVLTHELSIGRNEFGVVEAHTTMFREEHPPAL